MAAPPSSTFAASAASATSSCSTASASCPSTSFGRVDLNNIPLALVERVDTLTGGAAVTYGADAVSGVVNFITRRDFAGLELHGPTAITEQGDGNFLRGDLTIGANFDDGRGNAVLSFGYQHADPVYQGGDVLVLPALNSNDSRIGARGFVDHDPDGLRRQIGRLQVNPTGAPSCRSPAFNFNPYNIFQTPFQRFNIYGAGHYDVADNMTSIRAACSRRTRQHDHRAVRTSERYDLPLNNPFMTSRSAGSLCQTIDLESVAPSPRPSHRRIVVPNITRPTAARVLLPDRDGADNPELPECLTSDIHHHPPPSVPVSRLAEPTRGTSAPVSATSPTRSGSTSSDHTA